MQKMAAKTIHATSKCTVNSSHGQVITESTHHNAVIHDGQLVTRF